MGIGASARSDFHEIRCRIRNRSIAGRDGPRARAPDGKLFQASQSKQYTFRTEPSQRHAWRFDWLDATTMEKAGHSTLRMTTQTTTHAGLRSNEQPVRQGKHNTHVHSYYWFDAHDAHARQRRRIPQSRRCVLSCHGARPFVRCCSRCSRWRSLCMAARRYRVREQPGRQGRSSGYSDATQLYLGRHVPTERGKVLVRGRQRPPLPSKHWRAVHPTLTLDVASPLGTITR